MNGNVNSADSWGQVERLFPDLIDLSESERATFLDRHCAGDPALRAELVSLLRAATTGSLLDSAPLWTARADAPATALVQPGERFGPWRVLRLLGRGGMGEVYLAERADGGFEQRAAIKLMRLDAAQHLWRFESERSIVAQLDHPNIAHLLDGGVTAAGRPYMVMEYVEGEDLRAYCATRRLGLDARLALFEQVGRAVAYAHAHLVINRDLKPANILVTAAGQTKLLDFGIAKLVNPSESTGEATVSAPFTPDHAAPEQLQGLPATTAVDVYALGVVLYELLSGRTPWSFGKLSAAATVERLLREEPAQCSRAGRESDSPPVPPRLVEGDLDAIVAKCLRKTPQHRYATVDALLDDLRRWRAREPVTARGDALGYVARRWLARHRVAVSAGALILLALAGGLGAAVWQARRAEAEARRAEQQAEIARLNAARARSVKDFLVSVFVQLDPLRSAAGTSPSLEDAYAHALRQIEQGEIEDPVLRVDLLDDFGEIAAGRGDLDAAQKLFEQALERAISVHGEHHPAVAESLINLGVLQTYRGNILAGKEPLERAVAILEPFAEIEPTALASAITGLSAVRRVEGRFDEAIALVERALELERSDDPNGAKVPTALHNLAIALLDRGRHAEAEPLLREGIAMIEKTLGPQAGNLPHFLGGLELVLYAEGKLEEEARVCERRVELLRTNYAGDHAWVASALSDLGAIRVREGRHDEGEALIREAIGMFERLDSPEVVHAWRELGLALRDRGDHEGAAEIFQRTLELCRAHGLDNHSLCLVARANSASNLARLGRSDEALREADAAAEGLAASIGTASHEYAAALSARADALQGLSRRGEAEAARTEAYRILEEHFGSGHPEVEKASAKLEASRREE